MLSLFDDDDTSGWVSFERAVMDHNQEKQVQNKKIILVQKMLQGESNRKKIKIRKSSKQ